MSIVEDSCGFLPGSNWYSPVHLFGQAMMWNQLSRLLTQRGCPGRGRCVSYHYGSHDCPDHALDGARVLALAPQTRPACFTAYRRSVAHRAQKGALVYSPFWISAGSAHRGIVGPGRATRLMAGVAKYVGCDLGDGAVVVHVLVLVATLAAAVSLATADTVGTDA